MKVILDIMALGASYEHHNRRTGIFRVVDELAKGLEKSPNCNTSFVSMHYPGGSSKYLKEAKFSTKIEYPTVGDRIINKLKLSALNKYLGGMFPPVNLDGLLKQADIYHSPFFPIPPEIIERKSNKLFLTVHDLIPILHPQYFKDDASQLHVKGSIESIQKNGYFFCVSNSTKNDLCTLFSIEPERVFITPLAASKDRFYQSTDRVKNESVKEKYNMGNKNYFLSLSTLEPRKNIDHTIRCFIRLLEQEHIRDVYLVLVGSKGWNFDKIFNEIEGASLYKSKIILTGYVPDEDLDALYSDALAFIYPSFYEGFGLPPLEAMQCGTPVIVSNTSSLPEVVGNAGILVDPLDTDALCAGMLQLYNDKQLREKMSNDSLIQAKKFSWDIFINNNIKGYREVL
ncbi:MAG: glycosyltransferase family 4 protein [Mucilaginibacter sp.]|uniref:glycosyltransferase family 4 protein n=1 Tax=Mucilaginibacter sp. TaxID=1882438 RepID=UPI0034E51DC7